MATHGDKGLAWVQCSRLEDPRRPKLFVMLWSGAQAGGEPGMDREVGREVVKARVCPRRNLDTM